MTRILLTVCVSLCATRKYPHVNILRWFAKSFVLPLALSFSPDIDTICYTTLEIDSTNSCRKKLIWIQLDQLKLLDFDSQSNTSSWKLPFKSSVSYPCFWPQNSFFTSQQVSWSLRILKTLHLVRVRRCSVASQWCNDVLLCLENLGLVCQITRSQTIIISHSPYTKESKALIRMTECNRKMLYNCAKICLQTLSVQKCKVSENETRGKLWASRSKSCPN